jgi:hypothetical protein
MTWNRMRLVTRCSEAGEIAERTATTAGQQRILAALGMTEPSRYSAVDRSRADSGPARGRAL